MARYQIRFNDKHLCFIKAMSKKHAGKKAIRKYGHLHLRFYIQEDGETGYCVLVDVTGNNFYSVH